jgi:hypothetical protein
LFRNGIGICCVAKNSIRPRNHNVLTVKSELVPETRVIRKTMKMKADCILARDMQFRALKVCWLSHRKQSESRSDGILANHNPSPQLCTLSRMTYILVKLTSSV